MKSSRKSRPQTKATLEARNAALTSTVKALVEWLYLIREDHEGLVIARAPEGISLGEALGLAEHEGEAAGAPVQTSAQNHLLSLCDEAEKALYRLNGGDDLPGWAAGLAAKLRAAQGVE